MSTVDPAAERRRKLLESGPPRVNHLRMWLFIAICAALWALMGYGLADAVSHDVTSAYLAPPHAPADDTPPLMWMLFVGTFVGMFLSVLVAVVLSGIYGAAAGVQSTFAISLSAIALGFWRGAGDRWQAPQRLGFIDDLVDANRPWDTATWLLWTLQYWLPALLVLIAAALALNAARCYRNHRRNRQRIHQIVTQGTRTRGTVTDLPDINPEIAEQTRIRFVVKFTDHLGTERWVTKTGDFNAATLPRVGDSVQVWFMPETPGDESRIAVAFGSDEDADVTELAAKRHGSL